ncbi:MAG TPA: hypothetical protein VMB50_21490 [Myxococcales bacterium]|nr:hypothetical protein [Myxococcales bacterium]
MHGWTLSKATWLLGLGAAAAVGAALVARAARNEDGCPVRAPSPERFYCKLGAFTPAERQRHAALGAKLKAAASMVRESETGYAFAMDPARISIPELAEWIDGERRCCPFFDLQLEIEPHGRGVWLRLGGAAGVKAFIAQELLR